jgi:hypothetical protein
MSAHTNKISYFRALKDFRSNKGILGSHISGRNGLAGGAAADAISPSQMLQRKSQHRDQQQAVQLRN